MKSIYCGPCPCEGRESIIYNTLVGFCPGSDPSAFTLFALTKSGTVLVTDLYCSVRLPPPPHPQTLRPNSLPRHTRPPRRHRPQRRLPPDPALPCAARRRLQAPSRRRKRARKQLAAAGGAVRHCFAAHLLRHDSRGPRGDDALRQARGEEGLFR